MAVRDRATLKGYFITGAQPNQSQFSDFLDSTRLKSEPIPIDSVTFQVNALTFGSTTNWDANAGLNASLTLTGNTTLNILNAQAGQFFLLVVKQNSTGGYTITGPSGSKSVNSGSGAIALSGTANSVDIISGFYDGTNFYWMVNKSFT